MPNRPELIEKYGWDVKYGSHALRLAYHGLEIAATGTLTLPLPSAGRERVLAASLDDITESAVSAQRRQWNW